MLPKNLKYGTKVESAIARSTRVNLAPQNGTGPYGLGDTIIINIPTRNNLVLVPTESYLKFNFQVTSNADNNSFRLDSAGIHGIIARLRIFHGSNLLQDLDSYGMLAKMLFDLQQPTDATYGKQTILSGTRSDTVTTTPTTTADIGAAFNQATLNTAFGLLANKPVSSFQVNSGERLLAADGTTALIANTGLTKTETYCINLISLVGSLCSNSYIPLFAMSSSPLRVEIQLVSNLTQAVCCAAGANNTIAVSNCEYIANFIELGDPALAIIYNSLGGEPLQFVVPDFRNYQFTSSIGAGDGVITQVTFPIPAKFSSVKSLLVTCRDKGTGALTFFPFSSTTNTIQDYQFRVGATIMPPKPPSTNSEMFAEVVKAMGSIGDINYQPSIDKRSYSLAYSVANNDVATAGLTSSISSASFFIGLDLENYAAADKSVLFSGYNTNTDDTYLIASFMNKNGAFAAYNIRLDAYANFDSVIVCENNTAYCKF